MVEQSNYFNYNINFNDEWIKGLFVIQNMLNRKSVSKKEWHDLFTINSQIISWIVDGDKRLLCELRKEVENSVKLTAKKIHSNLDDNLLLQSYAIEWENYFALTHQLPLPFSLIERRLFNYSSKNKTKNFVQDFMLEFWERLVFFPISDRLLNTALKFVELERNGKIIDSKLILSVKESLVFLYKNHFQRYIDSFEKNYLNSIEQFYKSRAAQILQQEGILNYLAYSDLKLIEEEERGKKYLEPDSHPKLIETCVNILIYKFQDQFISESLNLIINNDFKRLNMLYRLLNKTPNGIDRILDILSNQIKTEGLANMQQNAKIILHDSEKFVEQLLSMYNQFTELVHEAFFDDPRFLTVRDQSFQEVVNNTDIFRLELTVRKNKSQKVISAESKCPELLANYCDLLLRKTTLTKRLTSEEIDEKLNNILLVLKYVINKDVFMRYHKTHVTRRLILELNADQEKEESLINKFRETGMPAEYINKLFRMLQDIEVNKDLNLKFKKFIGSNNNERNMSDVVNIKILNAGAWSGRCAYGHLTLPDKLEECIPEIEEFYRKERSGRKLNWMHHWSTGTILYATETGKYDLEVTTYQMAVLFAWNERPDAVLSFESLRLSTNLSDLELNRTLFSLINFPKIKSQVLLTDFEISPTLSTRFNDSSTFWLNKNFSVIKNDRVQTRGRINIIGRLQLSKETSHVDEDEHSDIYQLRVYRIQEAIVKIMKMRKQLSQAQLQTELVEVLKQLFLPSKRMIKEQIEWLIDHDYLKRDEENHNVFNYVT